MASEEDFSDGFYETETLVQTHPKRSSASPRPKSATKKGKKGLGAKKSVYGSTGNPYGSVKAKSSRELYLHHLKEGGSGTGSKKDSLAGRTPQKYWTDTLRYTGQGYTSQTANSNMQSFSGLKKSQTNNMGYNSTSHFLRQTVGVEKQSKMKTMDKGKTMAGTPAYKSQEEYYDQILELKKQIQALNQDNSNMKSKVGRLEKDNIKKEKEIEQLLDPSKSEEMRRTLADRRPDAGAVMHSLKQKILKLEKQLKEKEADYNKLLSDVKTTKIEELRLQMEAYYNEVLRLNQVKSVESPVQRKTSPVVKESPSKLKALQDTILKMNEKNYNLQAENKALKEDLDKHLEQRQANKARDSEYQDMTKKELLSAIGKLEKRLDKTEETTSMISEVESRSGAIEGKMTLQGSAAQRLDQLDKRETELLDELKKKNDMIKKLKEDRAHYRKKCDDRDKEITRMKKEIDELHRELDGFYDNDKNRKTPRMSPRVKKSTAPSVNSKRVEDFRQKYAAKKIQKGWRDHQRNNHDQEEATELIQAYMRAHQTRSKTLKAHRDYYDDDTISETQSDASLGLSAAYSKQLHSASSNRKFDRPASSKGYRKHNNLDSAGESEESDDIKSSTLGSSFTRQGSVTTGHAAPGRKKNWQKSAPVDEDDDDDDDDSDDDIVMPKKYNKGKIF